MVGWCTLFLQTIAKEAPPSALPDELAEREANHWWKAKKWSYYCLNRVFIRYAVLYLLCYNVTLNLLDMATPRLCKKATVMIIPSLQRCSWQSSHLKF